MLLIGSKALKFFGDKYLSSNAKRSWDYDYIADYKDFLKFKKNLNEPKTAIPMNRGKTIVIKTTHNIYEFEIAWENSTAKSLLDIVKLNPNLAIKSESKYIASPDLIFTLKSSHRYLKDSPHFLKTMIDYRHLRDSCGCKIPEELKDWYKARVKETYWYNHPNLNVSKETFFKDEVVPYEYDHDTIHLAMAHLDKPAYDYFKPNDKEVYCSKEMFDKCSEEIKLYAVLEESYVLALERSQIPAPGIWSPRKSFETALMKVCSSITSGWFREYAYENYFKVLSMYDDNYVNKFWNGVKSGIVRKL